MKPKTHETRLGEAWALLPLDTRLDFWAAWGKHEKDGENLDHAREVVIAKRWEAERERGGRP